MLKTTLGAIVGAIVYMELAQCKEEMKTKKWVDIYGATRACTLRVTTPWHNTDRIVIVDSWFGSVRTCLALMNHGLFSVLAIKTGSDGFPKQQLINLAPMRFDHVAMQKTFNLQHVGKRVKVIAAVWKDKKHRLVAATCGTNRLLPARERVKVKYQGGQIVRTFYDVELP
jgi:hypothetical protein